MANRRVLIVDDNRDLGENLAEILADAGFDNDFFEDPRRALETVHAGQYAAALIDIKMPTMDGVSLYRALKARDPALPAIAISAYAGDQEVRRALEAGVIAILPKPVAIPQLLAKLSSLACGDVVLVVEDDLELCQNIAEALADGGFSAREAHSCAEARALAAALEPTCVLVDCRLPDGSGVRLAEELCAGKATIPVLFSGYPSADVDPTGRLAAVGTRLLGKPLDLRAFLAWLTARTAAKRAE